MEKKIGALIVLYEPDYSGFISTFDSLKSQVDGFCIVDNSTVSHLSWFMSNENVIYVPLLKNIGIAAAQNIGIAKLHNAGYSHILFADQDSIAFHNLVDNLFSAFGLLLENGFKIAIVGCNAIDTKTGLTYKSNNVNKYNHYVINGRDFTHVDYVRSSISLTNFDIIDYVGGMDEGLFIDGVDCEWCWRARVKGYRTFISEDSIIYHCLGKDDRRLLTKEITIPSPNRLFYQYRNFLWLLHRGYVPLRWKLKNFAKYLIKIPYYSLFCSPGGAYFRNIMSGIGAGFSKNRM